MIYGKSYAVVMVLLAGCLALAGAMTPTHTPFEPTPLPTGDCQHDLVVTGRVTDASGAPLAGVQVRGRMTNSSSEPVQTQTDEAGNYTLTLAGFHDTDMVYLMAELWGYQGQEKSFAFMCQYGRTVDFVLTPHTLQGPLIDVQPATGVIDCSGSFMLKISNPATTGAALVIEEFLYDYHYGSGYYGDDITLDTSGFSLPVALAPGETLSIPVTGHGEQGYGTFLHLGINSNALNPLPELGYAANACGVPTVTPSPPPPEEAESLALQDVAERMADAWTTTELTRTQGQDHIKFEVRYAHGSGARDSAAIYRYTSPEAALQALPRIGGEPIVYKDLPGYELEVAFFYPETYQQVRYVRWVEGARVYEVLCSYIDTTCGVAADPYLVAHFLYQAAQNYPLMQGTPTPTAPTRTPTSTCPCYVTCDVDPVPCSVTQSSLMLAGESGESNVVVEHNGQSQLVPVDREDTHRFSVQLELVPGLNRIVVHNQNYYTPGSYPCRRALSYEVVEVWYLSDDQPGPTATPTAPEPEITITPTNTGFVPPQCRGLHLSEKSVPAGTEVQFSVEVGLMPMGGWVRLFLEDTQVAEVQRTETNTLLAGSFTLPLTQPVGIYRMHTVFPAYPQAATCEAWIAVVGADDADWDGVPDAVEQGHDCLNWLLADTDGDGLLDGEEDLNGNGVVDEGETSPCEADTDGDTLLDGVEIRVMFSDPLDPNNPPLGAGFLTDADGDALPTWYDIGQDYNADWDGDRYRDGYEYAASSSDAPSDQWVSTLAHMHLRLGDANGDGEITSLDALVLHALFLRGIDHTNAIFSNGTQHQAGYRFLDVNLDGAITNLDALLIQAYFLELIELLPYRP